MSEIRANTVSNAAGTGPVTLTGQYAAKAWIIFTGTGTVTIRQSGNISSITDNGTGDYTQNFASALTDTNYAVVNGGDGYGLFPFPGFNGGTTNRGQTTTSVRVDSTNNSGAGADVPSYSLVIMR